VILHQETGVAYSLPSTHGRLSALLLDLLCPVCQLVRLVNWQHFGCPNVNPNPFTNWLPTDKSQLTNGHSRKPDDNFHGVLGSLCIAYVKTKE
jgi:hypothetical protein